MQNHTAYCLLFSQFFPNEIPLCVWTHASFATLIFQYFHLCSDVYMCHTAICSAHMVTSDGNLLALGSRKSGEKNSAFLFYAQFTILMITDIKLILIFR